MAERRPVGIVGASGVAGRQALAALAHHPWFEITAVAASSAAVGRRLGDVLAERQADGEAWAATIAAPPSAARAAGQTPSGAPSAALPAALLDLVLGDAAEFDPRGLAAVFSTLPSGPAREIEARLAETTPVFSTASAWRMDADSPLLLAGVNGEHAALLARQQRAHGWRGFLAPGPNCTAVGLAVTLAPLQRVFGVRAVSFTSLQAVSGVGSRAPQVAAAVAGNILPFIAEEEEKVEAETRKILGAHFAISGTCTRVPVEHGHTLAVSVGLERPAEPAEVAALFAAEDPWRGRALPSRPARWILVRSEPDRPQPLLDRDEGRGLTTVVGRLRPEPVLGGVKYVVLSHNAVLGAAGGAVLLAEDLAERGLLPEV
ncbi:MAG: aspartate-semialdehyde dehydrogenase [Planctomycetota bacterium]